jgi:hypothetical protein
VTEELERRIRQRAHQIWESEGRPHGSDLDHWERARRELEAELSPNQSVVEGLGEMITGSDDKHPAPSVVEIEEEVAEAHEDAKEARPSISANGGQTAKPAHVKPKR